MKYNELIEVNQEFQSSVNLEYDLNKIEKIRGYIPTEQSVKVLDTFLRSFYYNSQERATVLIGPYGRGKSHLLLVLSALTSLDVFAKTSEEKKAARNIQLELCEKIGRVDKETGALAKTIVDTKVRTLPVIINSNTNDINQAFLIALNDALNRSNLERLLPKTYFDVANEVIEKWKKGFPEAYEQLGLELKKHKESVENLQIRLRQFDQKAYRRFCRCYPLITAGTEFNPLTNMDVVKLYIAVSNALKEQTEYCGISVVFDEFSKFLEANLEKSKMLNFKIIQDMAEAATRSKEAQLHFTCITHKEILDYSSSDSFKTVEGRFHKIRFIASSEQSYELIANAILKKDSFYSFANSNHDHFKAIGDQSAMTSLFTDLSPDTYERVLVLGCFPLSPLSSFALLHVSELVGQNERTLFTFLAQTDSNTLKSFIDTDHPALQWITIDYIYDYFQELFKKEVFNSSVHSVWAKADSAIRQLKDDTQIKIIKAIAIINIIRDERLKAVPAHIKAALLLDDDTFSKAITSLLKAHVLSQRDSSELVMLTANGVDVQRAVDAYASTSIARISACQVLTDANDLGFVIPRAYNDQYSMLRCFKCVFMEAKAFSSYKNANQLLSDYPYDGLVVYIVSYDETQNELALRKLRSFIDTPQIVLCVSALAFQNERLLKQYEAARRLLEIKEDPHFLEELEVLLEDLQKRISSTIQLMYDPSSEHSSFFTAKQQLSVSRKAELNHAISDICRECYSLTPVVNNEMVNKCVLNAQNTKARDLVVAWILQHSEDNYIPCMQGYGPEVSIFKSAFKSTGLDVSAIVADKGMNSALSVITDFIHNSEKNKRCFQSLYRVLSAPPYGMRKGIIPLYLAYILRQYKENIVLYYKGKEIELSASALNNLNDNPENYDILIESGTQERIKYLDELQALFSKYTDARSQSINRIYSIVKSMQNWVRSLPEYTKKYKKYYENGEQKNASAELCSLRGELLKFEINSRELLFESLPQKMCSTASLSDCYKQIEQIKNVLDGHLQLFKAETIKKLTALFVPGYQGGLAGAMMSWYGKLSESKKKHVFDSNSNAIISAAGALSSYDDSAILQSLVNTFTAIAIEDWNDELAELFFKHVSEAITRINEYVETKGTKDQEGHLLINLDGVSIEKTFTSEAISPLGKTALNNLKSVFEEYNEALEPDEQLAILAKLISEIIS